MTEKEINLIYDASIVIFIVMLIECIIYKIIF